MASRTVISLAMDLIGSTANGLKMSDNQFRRFNRALIDQIEAYIENFGLESAVLKFTGDGFFLSHPDLEMARTIVAFAKTISFRFQKDLADTLGIGEASVPAIRVAICTGDDQSIEMRDGQLEWVGDSARRAARACQQCWPNELIVSSTIYEKILRVFITRPIEITERNMQSKWEEPFTIYSVGEIRADYAEELRNDVDPAAPFIKYLDLTDRTPAASELASRAIETYEEESQSLGRAASPSEIIRLREREAQLRQLLYVAPDAKVRSQVVERMTTLGIPPTVPVYNKLIRNASKYDDALEWFHLMIRQGVRPDSITHTTLINLSPDIETATRWFDAMRKAGLQPDEVAYNSLIKRSPDLDTATRWFDAMQHAGVRPNRVTYCTLIARSPDMTSATRWFEAMGHAGIQPDTVTFNTLIKLSPDIASATQWFDAMGHAAVKPDVITYGTLINLSPDLATSEQWFDCMRKAGIKPNKEVMSSLPKHLSNPADADRLTTRLLSLGIFIKESYYTTLYKRIAHKLSAGDLLRWHSKQPNAYPAALFVAITVYVKEARIDDACRIALVVPYSATARKLFREHYSIAATYYRRFLQNGFDPYNTHYALAYCYFENGQLPEALTMFEKALQSSTNAKRSADITRCIEVIRSR